MTTTTTVPAWQTKIRAAQQVEERKIESTLEEDRLKQAAINREQAPQLRRALACLSIDAEPTSNLWQQDEYSFWLSTDSHGFSSALKFKSRDTGVTFTLSISRPDTLKLWKALNYADPYEQLGASVIVSSPLPEDGDDEVWQSARAQLAYALDELDSKHAEIAERLRKQESRAASVAEELETPSVSVQLARLIGQLVGEEVRNQLGHNDD